MRTETHTASLQTAANDVGIDVDLLFDALTTPRRRYVLAHLQHADEPIELEALADDIAHWELDAPDADVSDDCRDSITVSLYHVHLPKLADAGLVAYDRDESTVDTTEIGEKLGSLDCLPRVE